MIMDVQTDDSYGNSFAFTGIAHMIPFLQPIIDARIGALVGAEIVCRMNTSKGLTHNQFYIDKFASSELADFIVAQLLLKTAEHLSQYKNVIKDNFIFSLKMTYWQSKSLMLKDAVTDFKALFDGKITLLLEIVQHKTTNNPDAAPLINTFRVKSVNEEQLQRLQKENILAVKLDPLLTEICNDEFASKHELDKITTLANKSGMQVIAEGVESAIQKSVLLQAGIYAMQGEYFSPALSLADFCNHFS